MVESRGTVDFRNGCQNTAALEDTRVQEELHDQQEEYKRVIVVQKEEEIFEEFLLSSLAHVKLPNVEVINNRVEEEEDGLRTPTSNEHSIPLILMCPAAPRKPKSVPVLFTKRKRKMFVDEVQSLFPPALLADLGKKIRKTSSSTIL
ncbi:hypothetical protein A4A49_53439 [Nicotiana attenuata]|uniref:Uncharacterized protein n=1 Tax=Nicotiana attenuata TaxID=49451 RepID=A0A1J6ICP1_NICAT|nr:hypothetical protein A4A49_53439 [Nicotiana attenuata]